MMIVFIVFRIIWEINCGISRRFAERKLKLPSLSTLFWHSQVFLSNTSRRVDCVLLTSISETFFVGMMRFPLWMKCVGGLASITLEEIRNLILDSQPSNRELIIKCLEIQYVPYKTLNSIYLDFSRIKFKYCNLLLIFCSLKIQFCMLQNKEL